MKDYSLVKEIGQGGMGSVYEAYSPAGQRVALKKLASSFATNAEYRALFSAEVASLRMLNHPAIVGIKGETFADSEGNLYLPMEYIEGETVEKRVREQGPFNEAEAIQLMCNILDAFTYIHSCNCIHRDIKPSNIMLRTDGTICVIDFGIAKDMKMPTGKTIGRIIGSDGYMSPEQAKGDSIDSRTDIYSLGCLFYFLVCGKHAIKKEPNDYQTICSILNDDFPSIKEAVPTISSNSQAVLEKAVSKNLLHRFNTPDEFKRALCGEVLETPSTHLIAKKVITIGRAGCDINLPNEYVSAKHLVLEYYEDGMNNPQNCCLILTDSSSNGTSVDGKYLHRDKLTIPFCLTTGDTLPPIYLAGRSECKLDGEQISKLFKQKYPPAEQASPPEQVVAAATPSPKEKAEVGTIILSFLLPLVGWIYWGLNRKTDPAKAAQAAKAAWIGVVVNLLISFIGTLI